MRGRRQIDALQLFTVVLLVLMVDALRSSALIFHQCLSQGFRLKTLGFFTCPCATRCCVRGRRQVDALEAGHRGAAGADGGCTTLLRSHLPPVPVAGAGRAEHGLCDGDLAGGPDDQAHALWDALPPQGGAPSRCAAKYTRTRLACA